MGGMQKHSYYLCKYLAKQKINVDLYHFNSSNYAINKLEFFTPDEQKFIHSIVIDFPSSLKFPGHYIVNSYKYSKLIFSHIKGNLHQYSFIYTKGLTGWYLINQKNKGIVNCCNIGVKFHGYEMFQKAPDFKTYLQHVLILRGPVKSISLKADKVFSYGGKITDLIKKLGVNESKIIEIPSGIEASELAEIIRPTTHPIKFLYLGRYERRKGVEEINEALLNLVKENFLFEFHFIGNIPANKKINCKNIIYHGEIRDKIQIKDKIKYCDVLVCPSYSEGFPNVILEAMGNGLAVAATNVGAVGILVNKDNGWIIKKSSASSIIEIIKNISETDLEKINILKNNALLKIKGDFTWEKLILNLLNKIKS